MINEIIIATLSGTLPPWVVALITGVVSVVSLLSFILFCNLMAVWTERKLIGRFQLRSGPNRAGPEGLLQSMADGIKVMGKEAITPYGVDKFVYWAAPSLVFGPAFLTFAVIPFAPGAVLLDIDIGLLYIVAVGALGVIPVFMAGWASNNKFSLLGAMRAVAQTISYEIPLILSLVGIILLSGTLDLSRIVDYQIQNGWFLFLQPLAMIIFIIAGSAELNRTPTDIMEGESELVGGYHTEYSGFKFSLFYIAEYTHLLGISALIATLFLGGWGTGPVLSAIPAVLWFIVKLYLVLCFFVWVRATLPRLRIDQLMGLAWKFLIPLTLANIFVTAFEVYLALPGIVVVAINIVLAGLFIMFWSRVVSARKPAPLAPSFNAQVSSIR